MVAKPSNAQYHWHEIERSMFIHFGPATWQGREYDDGSVPVAEINPSKLDTDQWCRAAKSFGAGRIVFVAKHTGGFCWWQTETTDYGIRNTPWKNGKGDVLAELSESCKKHGLDLGVYIYPGDRTWGAYIGGGGKTRDPELQESYNKVFRKQLEEVLTNYGSMKEVWFDGSCVIDVSDILEKYATEAVIFQGPHATIRWCGTERGLLPDPAWSSLSKENLTSGTATVVQSDPNGAAWAPLEVDTTLYDHYWFWSKEGAEHLKSLDTLMQIYYQSVGRGGVLLLNAAPNTDGLIPEADMDLLTNYGSEINRRFASPISETSGTGNTVTLSLGAMHTINHVEIMEDYKEGERIRSYSIEVHTAQGWTEVTKGEHIGRKHIVLFEPTAADSIRIVVHHSVSEPIIRSLKAFDINCHDFESLLAAQTAQALLYDPVTDSWVAQNQGSTILTWGLEEMQNAPFSFELDISQYVTEPGQYELQFATENGAPIKVDSLDVLLEGIVTPNTISVVTEGKKYNITRTSAVEASGKEGSKTAIRGSISPTLGIERGNISIKRSI